MCHTPGPNTQSECAVLLLQGWGKTTPFSRKRRSQQLTRWFGPKLNTPSVPPREHVTHGVFRSMAMSGTLDTRNTWRCGSTACWDHVRSMVQGSVHAMEEMCISRGGPLRSRIHEAPICVTRSVMGQFGSQLSEPETPWMSTLQNLQIHCCLLPSVCLRLRCELTTSDDDSPNISLGLGICCYTAPFVKTHRCFRRKVTAHCPV